MGLGTGGILVEIKICKAREIINTTFRVESQSSGPKNKFKTVSH